jgi:hypothetical protein
METLRFKQLPHSRCRASVPWFLLLTSYFLIFPLRSNRLSLREFAGENLKCLDATLLFLPIFSIAASAGNSNRDRMKHFGNGYSVR